MALKKQCSYRGCSKVIDNGIKYCAYHQEVYDKQQKKRWNIYRKSRSNNEDDVIYQKFYKSGTWEIVREEVKSSCFGIDILEYYRTGEIIEGDAVHHIEELKEAWELRFYADNLIYLSKANHARVHKEYDKGTKEKKKMQNILRELKKKFELEFK